VHSEPDKELTPDAQARSAQPSLYEIEAASERLARAQFGLSQAEVSGDLCGARYARSAVASISATLVALTSGAAR
jgi:hypothetical protein